jgi:AAA+ superfamily predicted ATPase
VHARGNGARKHHIGIANSSRCVFDERAISDVAFRVIKRSVQLNSFARRKMAFIESTQIAHNQFLFKTESNQS